MAPITRNMIKLSDYVVNFIEQQGIKDVFLLPGGGCIHLIDSIGNSNVNFVCNLHEQACSIAADAYGQYTNNMGVCLVTTGPGATNAITGIAAAWLDSTPVLAISGQVQKKDMINDRGTRQIGFQEIDTVGMVAPITKYAVTVTEPTEIRYHLEKAAYLATNGRPGPVWIDIPLDVQAAEIDASKLKGYTPEQESLSKLSAMVSNIIEDLNNSSRPVMLVGNGVRLAGAIEEFKQLASMLKIPVLLTWKAIDFFEEDHPLFVGRPGGVGQRGANFSQQNSDFLISLGARLDHGQTAYQHKYFAREAKKVVVDIDPAEINKMQMHIDHPMPYDAGDFIREFISQSHNLEVKCSDWLKTCKNWQKKYPVILPEYWEQKDFINNYVFIDALSDVVPPGALLVPGSSGGCSEVTMQAFRMKKGQRMFNSEGLGPMGFGIAAAIGGCVASGHQETICIDGDGGFIMNIQELEVVKRLNLPIKFFVLNNNGYVSIRNTQNTHFSGNLVASGEDSGLTLPPIEKQAYAYGIPFAQLSTPENLRDNLNGILAIEGPVICEIMLPPTHTTLPKTSVYKKEDGSFAARPMEDLAPFLDREEFEENMIVEIVGD